MSKIYKGDFKHVITVDFVSPISSGTTFSLIVVKPDETEETWIGALSGTHSIVYTTVDGDFDQAGIYQFNSKVTTATGEFTGDSVTLEVYDREEEE
jgi:predicted ATP-dependent Lon-type protease